eukprot:gene34362-biopygen27084
MRYVFDKILPKQYWQKVSGFSVAYAKKKGAGTDVNAAKAPQDRHPRYQGKGQHREWNDLWVSPVGLLLFHQTLLLMVLNHRSNHEHHFSLNSLLRSVVAEQYSRNTWQQSLRFFCPYDIDRIDNNTGENYDPYFKFRTIRDTLHDGIHALINPPKVGSYDEGGKPYTGKGGEGLTVHYNPKKPNKRMTMCFMIAVYGIPLAWEFYTGQRSNAYNEKKFNSAEEAVATGTHRKNDKLPTLTWDATYNRGEYRWATAKHDAQTYLYMEYGDNKIVRFLSTKHGSPDGNPGLNKERWDSDGRKYVQIFLPQVKLDYDAGMGGCDLADYLEYQVRIKYRTRRPHLVNYFWHFETAVYSAHRVNTLLYPEEYENGKRTFHDDVTSLCESILKNVGSIRQVEKKCWKAHHEDL